MQITTESTANEIRTENYLFRFTLYKFVYSNKPTVPSP